MEQMAHIARVPLGRGNPSESPRMTEWNERPDAPAGGSSPSPTDLLARLQRAVEGRYEIQRELGRGGMGRVFLARDLKHGRDVAIKVLHPELSTALAAERFLREVRTTAQLTHPQILPMHDSGGAGGLLYYIMPYIQGQSLRDRMRREGPLPLEDAIRIVSLVAEALAYAHANGVIHRDLKPENILLQGPNNPLLADFGLARAIQATSTGRLTPTGIVIGSPLYMSPEQAIGEQELTGRSDQYSLGSLLYEMLAGQPPFAAPTPRAILKRKVSEEAAPLRSLRPGTPAAVDRAVKRAMHRSPEQRFSSVEEFVGSLRAPGGSSTRHRRLLTRGTAAFVVVVALVAGYLVLRPAKTLIASGALEPPVRTLVARFDTPSGDSVIASSVTELVRTRLGESPLVALVGRSQIQEALRRMGRPDTTELTPEIVREIALRDNIQAVLTGKVTRVGAGYLLSLEISAPDSARALTTVGVTARDTIELIDAVDRLAREMRKRIGDSFVLLRNVPPLASVTTSSLPALRKYTQALHAMDHEGDYAKAVALLEQAIAQDTGFAMAYRALGIVLSNQGGQRSRVMQMMRQAYRHRDRLTELERGLASAVYFTRIGDFEKAILTYRTVVDTYSTNSTALNNLGYLYGTELGDFARAEEFYHQALASDTSALVLANLYDAQFNQGRIREARETYATLSARYPDHPAVLRDASDMAAALGDYHASRRYALALLEKNRADSSVRIEALTALSALAALQGQLGEAEELAQQAMDAEMERGTPAGYLRGAIALAQLDLHSRGDTSRALRRVGQALTRHPLPSIPFDDRPYLALAWFYADAGRAGPVRALAREHAAKADPAQLHNIQRRQRSIAGALAMAEGRHSDALRLQEALAPGVCIICTLPQRGRAFEATGAADSAIAAYQRYVSTAYLERLELDAVWLPFVHQRLAALFAERGDAAKALAHTGKLVALWAGADPEFRARAEAAHRSIERLSRQREGG